MPYWSSNKVGAVDAPRKPKKKKGITMEVSKTGRGAFHPLAASCFGGTQGREGSSPASLLPM